MELIGNRKVTEADWKAGAEDILSILRERFGDEIPALFQENMITLAENYAQEQTEDVLKALGQELSVEHVLLYEIEEDSDSYLLTLIPEEETEAFEQEMKSIKRKAKVLLQPRKKPGTAAKRIDLGKRLPCKVCNMPENFRFKPQAPVDGLYVVDNLSFGGRKEIESGLLSLDPKPHVVYKIPKLLEDLTGENGRYAAIWYNTEKGEDGGLKDKSSYVAVGHNLADVTEWKVIHKDASRIWETCYWYGEDLFLAGKANAAVIKNAANGGQKLEMLIDDKEEKLTFPELFRLGDKLYLYMQGKIYRWQPGGFLKKEGFKTVVYTAKAETIDKIVPVSKSEVAFIERNYAMPRSSEIRMTHITLLNVESGEVKKIPCPVGNLTCVEEGKLLVLCSGHDSLKNKKQLPILISIDLQTGERWELPYGSMGTAELVNVYKSPEGRIILRTYEQNRVFYPENPEEFLMKY